MKKPWFKRKLYGWGWTFGTWESWVVTAIYFAIFIWIFSRLDPGTQTDAEVLTQVVGPIMFLTFVFLMITLVTGERARWQWGKRIEDATDVLRRGGVVVMPTDTTYGIVAQAENERAVHEIYRLRRRDLDKPFIVLIADRKELKNFGVKPTEAQGKILDRVWSASVKPTADKPGAVSVILPCTDEKFAYLHRGKNSLAFRLPAKAALRRLLRATGPLVAPSANPQGHPVAKTVSEARAYFGHHVDFYEDGGTITASPSRLIDITDGTEKVLR